MNLKGRFTNTDDIDNENGNTLLSKIAIEETETSYVFSYIPPVYTVKVSYEQTVYSDTGNSSSFKMFSTGKTQYKTAEVDKVTVRSYLKHNNQPLDDLKFYIENNLINIDVTGNLI